MLRKYQEWEEREINGSSPKRMANPAPGIPIKVPRNVGHRSTVHDT
ncbi:hypothetical protein FHS33_005362 [Streptomyces calvus]|uniref:Uncharacterized protein n=1 Tax=Streptomyces calvus TaxID=67282 RepID=A0AA40VIE8_9ACTN|nr:hypothetical protein [Streptomyces calvus]GGP72719.1 hypothetical protein GCM10010247_52630 [Streptomyces calvus]